MADKILIKFCYLSVEIIPVCLGMPCKPRNGRERILEMENIKIFVSHRIDLDSKIIKNDIFIPVRCGACFDERNKVDVQGDDTGENISHKRSTYSEFTVLYWAWKNQKADYYGLCHYRRYFSFSEKQYPEDIYGNVVENDLNDKTIKKYNLDNSKIIRDLISPYDCVFTQVDVSKQGYKNLYEQFGESVPYLHIKDLMTAIKIIGNYYPDYYAYADKYLNGKFLYPCNMFVMKREYFSAFCEWLFPLMEKIESELDITCYNEDEVRTIGHIGERLFGVYITYLKDKQPHLLFNVCQRVYFSNTKYDAEVKPLEVKNSIPIVIEFNDYYVPYAAVALRSMMFNASKKYHYDVIILNSDIDNTSQKALLSDLSIFHNLTLRFIDVKNKIKNINFQMELPHISKETFYRLLIPDMLNLYKKIVFLDCDLIVKGDISMLYNANLEGNIIGAMLDVDFAGEYRGDLAGIKGYADEVLSLENPYEYFNAGVMVLDLEKMREYLGDKGALMQYAIKRRFRYMDQDILNHVFHGHIKYLDLSWNVMSDCRHVRLDKVIRLGPVSYYRMYLKARKNPQIIHYAGDEKPWCSPNMDFASEFFYYARESMFYEYIIQRISENTSSIKRQTLFGSNNSWIYEHMWGDLYSRFIFPWKVVKPGARIVMYGGGIVGKTFLRQLSNHPYCHVITVVDQNPSATGIVEAPVIDVNGLSEMDYDMFDLVLIALERKDIAVDVRKDLELMGIPANKIKWVDPHRK